MRIMIKGGIWKNTEDEILKAAVMKYGLNQWSRISSLLVRKSAKQCKARWYEWLDPAIKKTEWTREEDEKLLHLAKIMPTQWRTIAPIIGRTPNQCLERYEKLLAQAVHGDDYDPKTDPRKLRPGEIDPHPETKPARPDPEDMDEDEKEMLAEARARLANTRGKKAKRKAREKQLEEAKRLAVLQKKRELRAAGIEVGTRERSKRALDPNREIAFHAKPQPGFHDTRAEDEAAKAMQQEFRPLSYQDLVSNRRKRIEKALLEQDKAKEARLAQDNMAQVVAQNLAINEASHVVRRGKLMLPAPQLSEEELADVARVARGDALDEDLARGGAATRALLAAHGQTPAALPTPRTMRTPLGGAGAGEEDLLMREAKLQAATRNLQTPLAGGEAPAHDPAAQLGSGITPARRVAATPNPLAALATPGRTAPGVRSTPAVHGTPLVSSGPSSARSAPPTPARDALGVNAGDRQWESEASVPVAQALAMLPKARGGYELALPEAPGEEEKERAVEMDAGELDAQRERLEEELRQREMRMRPAAVQRGLPRPQRPAAATSCAPRSAADAAVLSEVQAVVAHDNAKFPKKRKRDDVVGPVPELAEVSEEALAAARRLVDAEASGAEREGDEAAEELFRGRDHDRLVHAGGKLLLESATPTEALVQWLGDEFAQSRQRWERAVKQANKLEGKLTVKTKGLQGRHEELSRRWEALHKALGKKELDLWALGRLQEEEERRAEMRIERAVEALKARRSTCGLLQEQLLDLQRRKRSWVEAIEAASG